MEFILIQYVPDCAQIVLPYGALESCVIQVNAQAHLFFLSLRGVLLITISDHFITEL